MKLISIGYGNMVNAGRLISAVSPDSAPIKRIISEAKRKGLLIDATYGRKTKCVVVMDTGHVILSAVSPESIASRVNEGDK